MAPHKKRARKTEAAVKKAVKTAKPAVRVVSENEIHMKCWQWVQKTHPALLIFHVPNESQAPVQYRVKMKRKGLVPGVADFLAFPTSGRKFAIELKDGEGEQRPDQIKFQARWEKTGGVYYVVRTLGDFQYYVNAMTVFG